MLRLTRSTDCGLVHVRLGYLGKRVQLLDRLDVDVPSPQYHLRRLVREEMCARKFNSTKRVPRATNLQPTFSAHVLEPRFSGKMINLEIRASVE